MRRTADKIDCSLTQRRVGLIDRKNQFELDVETFGFEESKLHRGFGGEIGIRNHIRHSDFHGSPAIPHQSNRRMGPTRTITAAIPTTVGKTRSAKIVASAAIIVMR